MKSQQQRAEVRSILDGIFDTSQKLNQISFN